MNTTVTFRSSYTFRAKAAVAGQVTPPGQIEAGVLAIVERWNSLLPKNHVRLLNDMRFRDIARALEELTLAEILQAVEFYAAQPWQKQKGAWKPFDAWFLLPNIIKWFEAARDDEDKQLAKHPSPTANTLAAAIGKTAVDPKNEARKRFDRMPPGERREIWNKVRDQLPRELATAPAIMARVVELLMEGKS